LELKAARLSRQAQRLNRKAQAGLPPSDDEARPTTCPTREELRALKEISRARREQHRLDQEREAEELEALERDLMEHEARERETQATSEATTSSGRDPRAPVADSERPTLDNSQLSACDPNSPTELEIALERTDLSPEQKKYLGQKRFQNTTKMVPSDILTTARRVFYFHFIHVTDIVAGITARRTGARCTQLVPKDNSTTSGPRWTRTLPRYI
jgi:hypothetical protein